MEALECQRSIAVHALEYLTLADNLTGLQDLTRMANELVVMEFRPLEIYTVLLLEYLVLILIVSAAVRWLERRLQTDERTYGDSQECQLG